jgi:hypothetical protein
MAIQGTTRVDVAVYYSSNSQLSHAFVNGQRMLPTEKVSPKPLTDQQWDVLSKVERPLYGINSGGHAYTDVMENDGDELLRAIWDHCHMSLDGGGELEGVAQISIDYKVAHRVARALKLMAFGPESLLA